MARRGASPFHAVLVVDKPSGPTSHDVVRWVRRALGTRAVGHTGTLDPLATGVLVVSIGEATKLVPYLTAHDKTYRAEIQLGRETDTLDAQGETTEEIDVPTRSQAEWQALTDTFLGEVAQQVPRVSAVRIDGERSHVRARRGESFEPPTRTVVGHGFEVLAVGPASLDVRVHCGKGFFVRSFARDLARLGGTRGHLSALRRERSGPFGLRDAVPFEDVRRVAESPELRGELAERLLPLSQACQRAMPALQVDASAEADAFHGRPVSLTRTQGPTPEEGAVVCLLDESRTALAVARRSGDTLHVVRGFRGLAPPPSTPPTDPRVS